MEQVHTKYTQRIFTPAGSTQAKVVSKLELKNPAKRVLSITPICHINGVESTESQYKVTGKVITRAIFIDETDSYNSEERNDDFAVTIVGADFDGVLPSVRVLETNTEKQKGDQDTISSIHSEHIVAVSLSGLKPVEVSYVNDVRGEGVEVKHVEREICTFNECITEKFDIGEIFKLDASVEGVLGVELNATVRDIVSKDDKITIKGVAVVGVSVVRGTDDGKQIIQNNSYDFEFNKTLKKTGEIVFGNVAVNDCTIKIIEHREKPELVLDATLLFTGASVSYHTVKSVEDAICPKHEIDFAYTPVISAVATRQTGVLADIEGNISLGNNAPYMSRVLWSSSGSVGSVNVKPADDKVVVEGILNANLVYECEEHQIHTHTVEVPFSVGVKVDGVSGEHNIGANVVPLSCNIKARRGKELLIDARIGITVSGDKRTEATLISGATEGAQKTQTGAAIVIHVVQAGETLWDLAKRTGISTAEIIRQNAGIENGLNGGERIVTYRRRAV